MKARIIVRLMSDFWCNGGWVGSDEFTLSPTDRGVILGLAIFETMLAVDGRLKFVPAHLKRWKESCDRLGWRYPDIDLGAIGAELLSRNGLAQGRGRLRITMTAGSGPVHGKEAGSDAITWITATPVDAPPDSVSVLLSPWRRNERSPLAGLKTASYAENILALDRARASGFDETLFLNTSGCLCEGATSNVFIVRGGRVLTPSLDSGCLPGVTRSVLLDLIGKMNLICMETSLQNTDLENADEIFLTSAIRGPVPVSRLDQRVFPATPVADSIRTAWRHEICRG
jgi:branched-chain amino acid aminotransferase